MNLVYVLVPFFKIDSQKDIEQKSKELLSLPQQSPFEQLSVHQLAQNQFALELKNFNLHFLEINSLLQDYNQMKRKIDIYETILKQYEPPAQNTEEALPQNPDILMKKMKKYKQIKEENKKLKKLLQVQLENTEKVREQTQKTMKVLRQEFDALVSQMSRKDKNSAHSSLQSHSNPPELEAKEYKNKDKNSQQGGGKQKSIR